MEETSSASGSARFPVAVTVLAVLLTAVGIYAFHEHKVSQQLTEQNSAVNSALSATRDQLNTLSSRLDALNAQRGPEKPAATHPGVYRKPLNAASSHHRIDDPALEDDARTAGQPGEAD